MLLGNGSVNKYSLYDPVIQEEVRFKKVTKIGNIQLQLNEHIFHFDIKPEKNLINAVKKGRVV